MLISNNKQGTDEWLKDRQGKITGTIFKKACGKDIKKIAQELSEKRNGAKIEKGFFSESMQWGIDHEEEAIKEYSKTLGADEEVKHFGFCTHPKFQFMGLSPDGFILKNGKFVGGLEVKCPNTKNHEKYIVEGKIPNSYIYQVYSYFLVNEEIDYVDFVSYDPRAEQKLFICRIEREDIKNELMTVFAKVLKLNSEVNKLNKK